MTTITCDRCGRQYQKDKGYWLETTDLDTGVPDEHEIIIEADLCQGCHEALVNWLKAAPLP